MNAPRFRVNVPFEIGGYFGDHYFDTRKQAIAFMRRMLPRVGIANMGAVLVYGMSDAQAQELTHPHLCNNCALYDLDATRDGAGNVRAERAARCLWRPREEIPLSLRRDGYRFPPGMTRPGYMLPNDGAGCPCWTKRPGAATPAQASAEESA
jgi:hypothetical protein